MILNDNQILVAPHPGRVGIFHVGILILFTVLRVLMRVTSEGYARMTLFAADSNARTFDYQVRPLPLGVNGRVDLSFIQAGDIAYVPAPYGMRLLMMQGFDNILTHPFYRALRRERWEYHSPILGALQDWYVVNKFQTHPTVPNRHPLERYQDVSLSQWLALTPPELVKDHLGVSDETVSKFQKDKQYVIGPK